MAQMDEAAHASLVGTLDADALRAMAVANSDEGRERWARTPAALTTRTGIGVCANGATLCDIGGPPARDRKAGHTPVPGGRAAASSADSTCRARSTWTT
jgi:hypothetical protein